SRARLAVFKRSQPTRTDHRNDMRTFRMRGRQGGVLPKQPPKQLTVVADTEAAIQSREQEHWVPECARGRLRNDGRASRELTRRAHAQGGAGGKAIHG